MTAQDFKAEGNKYFSAGDYSTAIEWFSKGIESDPSNHVLYSNRSACFASLQKYKEALQDADKTVELNPSWAKGYSRKGAALHGLGQLQEASDAYTKGLSLDPSNAQLKKGLSDVEAALFSGPSGPGGDPLAAMSNLFSGDVLSKIASNPKLAPLLAQPDLVQKIQAVQQNPQMIGSYMQDPRMLNIMMGLMGLDGAVATSAEEADEIIKESGGAPQFSGESKTEPAPQKSEPVKPAQPEPPKELSEEEKKRQESDKEKAKGNDAYKKRKFEEALDHYGKAIEIDDTNVAVLTNKSAVLFEMEKFDECIATCEQAVDKGREFRADYKLIARALGRIGSAYSKKDDLENAIKYFGKSLAEHRTADILEKLREVESLKKKRDEQNYINPVLSDEEREKGNVLFKNSDFAGAVRHYTEAIKRNPKDPRNFSNRAACFIKLLALPEADKDADEAIALDPSFVKAYIRKANILFAKRDYMKSIDKCNEAMEKDVEKKHVAEIQGQIQKAYMALNQVQSGGREETLKRAMQNPEVAAIMNDPVMQTILKQMQEEPGAVADHMKNPAVADKIRTLINAGIIQTR